MPPASQDSFRALADPTRREILNILATGPKTIREVALHFDITRPAVKKHLSILQEGQLITVETRGRERINSLSDAGFRPVLDWLSFFDGYWNDRLASLKSTIEKDLQ
jgi:DNA-binding transcriptional ArsR family regulator